MIITSLSTIFDALNENRACVHRKSRNVLANLKNKIRKDGQDSTLQHTTSTYTKDEKKLQQSCGVQLSSMQNQPVEAARKEKSFNRVLTAVPILQNNYKRDVLKIVYMVEICSR